MHAPQEKNQSVYGDLNWFELVYSQKQHVHVFNATPMSNLLMSLNEIYSFIIIFKVLIVIQ